MAWFNADDKMHSHPKSRAAGLEAIGLWTLAGTYCTDYLTDGAVPLWFVESWPRGKQLASKLIKAGFWAADGEDYQFLSWDEYQRTKEQVLAAKEKAAERKAKFLREQGRNK
jgi:hypothetical protein